MTAFATISLSKGNSEGYPMSKWRQEQIWIEAVDNETKALKNWNEHWSFTVDYDQRVRTFMHIYIHEQKTKDVWQKSFSTFKINTITFNKFNICV